MKNTARLPVDDENSAGIKWISVRMMLNWCVGRMLTGKTFSWEERTEKKPEKGE